MKPERRNFFLNLLLHRERRRPENRKIVLRVQPPASSAAQIRPFGRFRGSH